jgi:RHS repeat-associated protein
MKLIKSLSLSLVGVLCVIVLATVHSYAENNLPAGTSAKVETGMPPPCVSGSPTTINGSRCGPGQVTLSVVSIPSGFFLKVFDETGTAGLFTTDGGTTFLSPSISTTTNYMVAYWRPSDGCTSIKSSITATINPPLSVNAGADQSGGSMCVVTTTTISASPSGGTWSIVSGSGGSIGSASSSSSSFSGIAGNSYTLRWTAGSGNCVGSDDVVIAFGQNPSAPNAGPDQTACINATLSGNTPSVGTGSWSIAVDTNPGGTISPTGSPSATLSGNAGIYRVAWTTTNGACQLSDEAMIILQRFPTVSNAGADLLNICGTTTVALAANSPTSGTGSWSVVSGSGGSFGNSASPTSSFSGTVGVSYTLRWTISNSCSSSTDDMIVSFYSNPTTANAGPDRNDTSTCGLTTLTLAANTPSIGTGSWSIVSGAGGSFGNASSPTSTFSGDTGTSYTLRWTISNSPCTASTDDVIVLFRQAPTTAHAGADINACGVTTVNLAGGVADSGGTGAWSIVSGTGGSFGNTASPLSTFTGTMGSSYTLRWTISANPCPASMDDVVVTFSPAITAYAGPDQTGASTCGLTSVTLAAANPSPSTGAWSVVSGSGGSFGNVSSATSTFTGTVGVTYTLRWTVTAANGCTATDNVDIKLNQNPTVPNAGVDQSNSATCGLTSVTISANPVSVGTGQWSVANDSSPGGSIADPASLTTTLSGQAAGAYGAVWTTTNGVCVLMDEAVVIFNVRPTNANAGPAQTGAATCGLTSVTLAGNTPTVGTGSWSVLTGTGGTFGNSTSPTSSFSGTAGTAYTLRWTTSNMACVSTSNVAITFNRNPTPANAGADRIDASTCGASSITLAANTPSVGAGTWSVLSGSGGSFGNTASAASTFAGTIDVSYTLRWTTSNSPCTSTTDDVLVKLNKIPDVSVSPATQTIFSGQTATIAIGNPNNEPGTTFAWTSDFLNTDVAETSTSTSLSGTYTTADGVNDGTITYTVFPNSTACGGSSTTATVTVLNIPDRPAPTPPLFYGTVPAQFTAYAPDGAVTQWYTAATGGTAFATGDVYTNTSLTDPLTYYVSFKNQANAGESQRTQVTAVSLGTVNPASVVAETIRVSGKFTEGDINGLSTDSLKSVTVTYADGLSRATQTIAVNASPGKNDIVAPVEYDNHGQIVKQYLPYTKDLTNTTTDPVTGNVIPNYQTNYKVDQSGFYTAAGDKVANDPNAFAQTVYERSPLARPLEQGRAGSTWQPGTSNTKRIAYSFNKSADGDDVRIFNTTFTVGIAVTTQSYADTTLLRTTVTDENGHKTIVFANFAGQTLMRKQQLDTTINSQNVDYLRTAYVYDEVGRLSYIVPPAGYVALQSNGWVLTQAILDSHIYQFAYDNRGRVTKKKTPGQDWIFYGYDKLNRLVLVQDGNTRPQNKWAFVKYDQQNRMIMTGLYTNASQTTLPGVQAILDGLYVSGPWFEVRGTTLNGYTNQSFPTQNADATALDVMSVTYFDDYDFDNNGTADYTYDNAHVSGLPATTTPYIRGAATGSQRKILGTTTLLKSVVFYDNLGRAIQTQANNHLNTSAVDKGSVVYDFEGKAISSRNFHNAGGTNQVTVDLTPGYDHGGRVKYLMHNINGLGAKKVVNSQFNELGQIVMKQLHNVGGSTYIQNVDYRYGINGWLTSINNASLTNDSNTTNGDTNDYFGMEMLYETTDSGLGNKKMFDGNLSAVKWKSVGAGNGTTGESGYNFYYDKTDKLMCASFKKLGSASWNVDVSTMDETIAYDYNGNITSLQRKGKDPIAGTAQLIDGLSYIYANGNLLSKVDDSSGNTAGFNNGANTTTEYTYDTNGNLTADSNKGISAITYNVLGKPSQITFNDGRTIVYTYDTRGSKLKMVTTVGATTTTTDYVNGFVYTNGVLDFFGSPEGRVKKNGSSFEYQYNIADHQGNTRIVFTSATPAAQTMTATYETAAQGTESTQFLNYPSGSGINPVATNNHTPGGTKSQYLHGGTNGQVGVAKSYKVFPGDQVKIEAYARYSASGGTSNLANFAAALLSAFQLGAPVVGETGTASSAINSWGTLAAGGFGDGSTDSADPKAFVNILIFDKNYKFLDVAYSQVTSSSSPALLSASYTIKEPGYAYLYISNENPTLVDVYFDDVAMTFTPTNVIQSNEYYPFGLQTANSWTRDNNKNNFLYNEGSELNTTSGLYDLPFRNYDASLGRFFQVDPMAASDHTLSPFAYAGNNPVNLNDPSGLMVDYSTSMANPDYVYQLQVNAEGMERGMYNSQAMARSWGWDVGAPRGGGAQSMSFQEFIQEINASGGLGGSWKNGSAVFYETFADVLGASNWQRSSTGPGGNVAAAASDGSGTAVGVLAAREGLVFDDPKQAQGNPGENHWAGFKSYFWMWGEMGRNLAEGIGYSFRKAAGNRKLPGFIIVGRGGEQYSLKTADGREVGVVDLNDKNGIFDILNIKVSNNLLETGLNGVALYYENPLNEWYGSFFDRVPVWMESTTHPGFYWNTAGDQGIDHSVLYKYVFEDGTHSMRPTTIPRW